MMFNKLTLVLVLLNITLYSFSQNASIYGKVVTNERQPVNLISITILNSRWGTTTDENDAYRINNIKPGEYTIQLSFTGDIRDTKAITLNPGTNTALNFIINEAPEQFEEAIVETNKIMNRTGATSNKLPLTSMETPEIVHSISMGNLTNEQYRMGMEHLHTANQKTVNRHYSR